MSLQLQIINLATAIATDYKQMRTWITGSSSGTLDALNTTTKASIIAAINEVNTKAASGVPATETVAGIGEVASLAEMATGTDHSNRFATPAGVRQERLALRAELLGGADPAWDTLQEMKALVDAGEESGDIAALTAVVGQKANSTDVYTKTEIGNNEYDFVAAYNTAKA